jgi:hypothetical protein
MIYGVTGTVPGIEPRARGPLGSNPIGQIRHFLRRTNRPRPRGGNGVDVGPCLHADSPIISRQRVRFGPEIKPLT